MSSQGSAPTLRLEPIPSIRLHALLGALYVLAGAGLLVALPLAAGLPALAAGAALLCREWRGQRRARRLRCDAHGGWWLDDMGPFALQPGTVVSPWLVVLVLRARAGTRRLALLPDSLPPEQWRRLRVHLRTASLPGCARPRPRLRRPPSRP